MIIGDGLIANSLKSTFVDSSKVIVFASGVSNSKETDTEVFNREINLIQTIISTYPNRKFIYYSTCSVAASAKTPYINHKLYIEDYIKNTTEKYLIIRLPNIVGRTKNINLLVNYLHNCLVEQKEITININCRRHLIDVVDIGFITHLICGKAINKIINVAYDNAITLEELVSILENCKGIKYPKVNVVDGDVDYVIDNSEFLDIIQPYVNAIKNNWDPTYIINKYFS